MMNNKEKRAW